MNKTIGVVAALPGEARALTGHPCRQKADGLLHGRRVLKEDMDLLVVQSGMGMKNAFSAARWLSGEGVAALGCVGVSGGLDPRLKTGDVVFADAVLRKRAGEVSPVWEKGGGQFDETFKCAAAQGLSIQWGPVITVQKPVLNAQSKKALFEETKALAVDMETASAASVANQSGLPFFAIRTICDPANVSVSEALFQWVDEKGNPRISHLLKGILQKPSLITQLLNMKRNFHTALAGAARIPPCLAEMHIPPAP